MPVGFHFLTSRNCRPGWLAANPPQGFSLLMCPEVQKMLPKLFCKAIYFFFYSPAFFQNPLKKHRNKYLFVKTAQASAAFMFYNVKNDFAVLYTLALGYCLQSFHLNPSCCFPFEFKPLFSLKLFRAGIVLGGTIISCLKIRIAQLETSVKF